jgi:hypothetical protein
MLNMRLIQSATFRCKENSLFPERLVAGVAAQAITKWIAFANVESLPSSQ